MGAVVIGMDPHRQSVTIEIMDSDETVLGGGRYATDVAGYRAMLAAARRWPERTWAIEGCQGIGGHIASRSLADGERVVDVPPKLSARARVFATGQGRKTDATDAHSVALVAVRMSGLRPPPRREERPVRSPGQGVLATVRPRDAAGKARRRVAAELIADLERIYQRTKAADKELRELLAATGSTLTKLHGIGPSGAARLLVEVGDIAGSRTGLTSRPGTAPRPSTRPPASMSGTGCRAAATGRSTGRCTSWPSSSCATPPRAGPTTTAKSPRARPRGKPCEHSNDDCPTSSTTR